MSSRPTSSTGFRPSSPPGPSTGRSGSGRLAAAALLRVAIVVGVGAVVGAVIAAAASPLFPLGAARLAEPDPGFSVNLAVLGGGLVATVLVVVVAALVPAWRAARTAGSAQG